MQQDIFCETCMRTWKEDEIGSTNHCPECGDRLMDNQVSPAQAHQDDGLNITDLMKKYNIEYKDGKYHWQGKTYTSYREPLAMAQQRDVEKNNAKQPSQETPDIPAEKEEKIIIAARTPDEIPDDLIKNPLPYDAIHIYDDVEKLKKDILEGKIRKDYAVKPEGDGADTETVSWKSLEEAADDLGIKELYQSKYDFIKKFSMQWGQRGFFAALAIFAFITLFRFYFVLPELGVAWIIFLGGLVLAAKAPKWRIPIYLFLGFIPKIFGLKSSVFWMLMGGMFSTLVLSALYGFPLGMITGTIVGHIREKKQICAPEADKETNGIYMKNIILPLCCLVIAVIAHYFFSLYAVKYFIKT